MDKALIIIKKIKHVEKVLTCEYINEWTGVAILCCHWKSSSYIPTS